MSTTTVDRNETVVTLEVEATDDLPDTITECNPPRVEAYPIQIGEQIHAPASPADGHRDGQLVLAVFCYEDPDSFVGQYVSRTVALLAGNGTGVHLFARRPFAPDVPGVRSHAVGECEGEDLLGSVQEFTRRACDAFLRQFPGGTKGVTLLAHDWSAVSAVLTLKAIQNCEVIVEYHSVEWQRSDVSSEVARQIAEIEVAGLREARTILVHQEATRQCARHVLPECDGRIVDARQPFPVHLFQTPLDPGQVKARFHVGPVDPTILYIGDLSEQYGPDLLVKAMPAILKNHTQVRLVIVGDGSLYWPMRVYSRYLLLDHAIRFAGDVQGQALFELIQAADIIAVPSRESTPWWPILAAWAARRPVVATHEAASLLLGHEQDSVLVYPNEGSLVWGIERLLFDLDFGRAIARRGHQKLQERFGEKVIAEQIEELMGITPS